MSPESPPTQRLAHVLLALLLASLLLTACRRGTTSGSTRISPYREIQHYTLEGPLTPRGLPITVEQVRLELKLRNASEASGTMLLFRNDAWTPFGRVSGSWDGTTMTLTSGDGRGSAAHFELAFADSSVRGTALIFFVRRGETVRYGVDLGYR